jgi:hypothetical protein
LSFRPKQTDAFSSTFAPAKVSVCAVEKSLFALSRSPADFRRRWGIFFPVQPKLVRIRADVFSPFLLHSTIIRSAHSTSETKIAGFPNFAPH